MRQLRQGARFAIEARQTIRRHARPPRPAPLHGNVAIQPIVPGPVDITHAAGADYRSSSRYRPSMRPLSDIESPGGNLNAGLARPE